MSGEHQGLVRDNPSHKPISDSGVGCAFGSKGDVFTLGVRAPPRTPSELLGFGGSKRSRESPTLELSRPNLEDTCCLKFPKKPVIPVS